jgi:hypothetical protein
MKYDMQDDWVDVDYRDDLTVEVKVGPLAMLQLTRDDVAGLLAGFDQGEAPPQHTGRLREVRVVRLPTPGEPGRDLWAVEVTDPDGASRRVTVGYKNHLTAEAKMYAFAAGFIGRGPLLMVSHRGAFILSAGQYPQEGGE